MDQQTKARRTSILRVGLFSAILVSFFGAYIISACSSGMVHKESYVGVALPVFRMSILSCLHAFVYKCNLFIWEARGINYNFILEFTPDTAICAGDAFLIGSSYISMIIGFMIIHLILRIEEFWPHYVDIIPGIVFLLFMALVIWPFNNFYYPTLYGFLCRMCNIVFLPKSKVLTVDIFLCDQLTSQISLLRSMKTIVCYFIAVVFKIHQNHTPHTCTNSTAYHVLAYVISFMPYLGRVMQCASKWYEESNIDHVINLGKYVSAMLALGAWLTFTNIQPTSLWQAIAIVTSLVATLYQLYWDFVKDWGILNSKSKNLLLRDELIFEHKSIYYVSIVFNIVLRLTWVMTVMHLEIGWFNRQLIGFFVASLEIIRRGLWNVYRLENLHFIHMKRLKIAQGSEDNAAAVP